MTPAKSARKPARPLPHLSVRSFPPDMPGSAWLKLSDVLQFVPVGRTVWFKGVADGRFPAPTKVGRLAFWKARDIRQLLDMGPRKVRARRPANTPPETPTH